MLWSAGRELDAATMTPAPYVSPNVSAPLHSMAPLGPPFSVIVSACVCEGGGSPGGGGGTSCANASPLHDPARINGRMLAMQLVLLMPGTGASDVPSPPPPPFVSR